jgi:aspartyl-tRNA(Asn)/glutamyl-tRNA(Gln) amidotransferase subunit A
LTEPCAALTRRDFVRLTASSAVLTAVPAALSFGASTDTDPTYWTLAEAGRQLRARKISSVELTRAMLDRIAVYDPKLKAYITVASEDALAQAASLDAEAKSGKFRGPLHGIPIALKDNIDTAGIRTTAGSEVFDNRFPTQDAVAATRLKIAGAIMLGKTNMHEFALGHTSASTYFKPVRNPWALDHIPAGSSGGSAAALAAGLCYGALGTDTGGSVRMPSAYCSVVGFKPTYGLVSLRGIIPLTYSLDHCGPMARTVEDAALMLNSLAAYDEYDIASIQAPSTDYGSALKLPVSSLRIGIPRAPYFDFLADDIAKATEDALKVLAKLTKNTRECHLPDPSVVSGGALGAEMEAYHRELFLHEKNRYSLSLQQHMTAANQRLNDETQETCAEKLIDYVLAQRQLQLLRRTINDCFSDFDVVVLPTMRILPLTISEALARDEHPKPREPEIDNNCTPFDIFGVPAISIPCGFSKQGFPIGLMIAGRRLEDAKVLALANAYQQSTDWHLRRPALTPNMPVPPIKEPPSEQKSS